MHKLVGICVPIRNVNIYKLKSISHEVYNTITRKYVSESSCIPVRLVVGWSVCGIYYRRMVGQGRAPKSRRETVREREREQSGLVTHAHWRCAQSGGGLWPPTRRPSFSFWLNPSLTSTRYEFILLSHSAEKSPSSICTTASRSLLSFLEILSDSLTYLLFLSDILSGIFSPLEFTVCVLNARLLPRSLAASPPLKGREWEIISRSYALATTDPSPLPLPK